MTFEEKIMQSIQQTVIKNINDSSLVVVSHQDRMHLPSQFISQCWDLVDQDALKKALAARLELELIDRLVNSFASEMATDIKSVLSTKERREEVRAVVRENIDRLTGAKL